MRGMITTARHERIGMRSTVGVTRPEHTKETANRVPRHRRWIQKALYLQSCSAFVHLVDGAPLTVSLVTSTQGLRFFSESPAALLVLLFRHHATSEMRGCLRVRASR